MEPATIFRYPVSETSMVEDQRFYDYEDDMFIALVCLVEPEQGKCGEVLLGEMAEITAPTWTAIRKAFQELGLQLPPLIAGLRLKD